MGGEWGLPVCGSLQVHDDGALEEDGCRVMRVVRLPDVRGDASGQRVDEIGHARAEAAHALKGDDPVAEGVFEQVAIAGSVVGVGALGGVEELAQEMRGGALAGGSGALQGKDGGGSGSAGGGQEPDEHAVEVPGGGGIKQGPEAGQDLLGMGRVRGVGGDLVVQGFGVALGRGGQGFHVVVAEQAIVPAAFDFPAFGVDDDDVRRGGY